MPVNPFAAVQEELAQMEATIEQELRLRAGHLAKMVSLEMNWLDKYLYPGVVLLAARLGGGGRLAVPLACVVQFIRLAGLVHRQRGDGLAFRVLAGDYLYTKFFAFLCRYDALRFLGPLARAICAINEGSMIRRDIEAGRAGNECYPLVMELEYGRLLAEAGRSAAYHGGAGEEVAEALARYGLHLGTAWGLAAEERAGVAPRLELAVRSIKGLPEHPARNALEALPALLLGQEAAVVG